MDFAFMGGSMGADVGERVALVVDRAVSTSRPLVVVCASGGARMQEGVVSLFQMVKTSQAMARLHEQGLFSVCVLTDPTFGGVSASFAMLGSVVIAERGAHVGFAGPRVIKQTMRCELPASFQDAEFLFAHGLVDRVEHRAALRPLLARLLAMHAQAGIQHGCGPVLGQPDVTRARRCEDPWQTVCTSRDIARPTTLDHLRDGFDDFVELHGDRAFADDPAIVGGLGSIGGRTVVVIGHQKGHTTAELVARRFGMPCPEGYRKALRLMDYAERFGFPVVTLVDTPGACPDVGAEERGQATWIAELIMRSARLRVPVVSAVTGEGGSGGALVLCVADRLLVFENGFLSVISPEGCAAILWRTADAAPEAARALRLGAGHLVQLGLADGVVPEPAGGAQTDPEAATAALHDALIAVLREVCDEDPDERLRARYRRYRAVGRPNVGCPAIDKTAVIP
jgi:acetyl-CoA carboxylase carboxyl transferase subunit beta